MSDDDEKPLGSRYSLDFHSTLEKAALRPILQIHELLGTNALKSMSDGILGHNTILDVARDAVTLLGPSANFSDQLGKLDVHTIAADITRVHSSLSYDFASQARQAIMGLDYSIVKNPFSSVQDAMSAVDHAARWRALTSESFLPSMAILTKFDPPTALMTFERGKDPIASITCVTTKGPKKKPHLAVAAMYGAAPAEETQRAKDRARPLRIERGSAINCKQCGEPFDVGIDIYWTGPNRVFFQGEMDATAICSGCAGLAVEDDFSDIINEPTYKFRRTRNGEGWLYLIEDNTRKADDEDE